MPERVCEADILGGSTLTITPGYSDPEAILKCCSRALLYFTKGDALPALPRLYEILKTSILLDIAQEKEKGVIGTT